MEKLQLTISSSPHVRASENTQSVMRDVLIALLPATIGAVYFFRMGAVINIIAAIAGSVLAEYVIQKILKKPCTISDLSAVITGLLLAFNVPASSPWWMSFIGGVFAIGVAKQLFGGLGHNFVNPALAARAVLLSSWPVRMTSWVTPGPDAAATATPLVAIKGAETLDKTFQLKDMFLGSVPGTIGETSALLLIIGGIYLIYKGVIKWVIPVIYIVTVAILTFLFSGCDVHMMMYNVLGGGLMLGAIFMATDYVTSPNSEKGQIIFAIGCGVLTSVIRYFGSYPEGVSYSILLMNVCTPLIDKLVRPKVFGEVKSK